MGIVKKWKLNQKSTWTGTGSLCALAVILGVPGEAAGMLGAVVIGILNIFDIFRDEKKQV